MSESDTWTTVHDIAFVYVSMAYTPDHQIAERELLFLKDSLVSWLPEAEQEDIELILMEVLAALTDPEGRDELLPALRRLYETLTEEDRQRVLEHCLRIAEADGQMRVRERRFIHSVADALGVRRYANTLLRLTTLESDDWTLLHDIALMGVIVAHTSDNRVKPEEVHAILDVLMDWVPEELSACVEDVLEDVLITYGRQPSSEAIARSVFSIRDHLKRPQRLAFIEDLYRIAGSDGEVLDGEFETISQIADLLGVGATATRNAS